LVASIGWISGLGWTAAFLLGLGLNLPDTHLFAKLPIDIKYILIYTQNVS
jgi:hypothetical protein